MHSLLIFLLALSFQGADSQIVRYGITFTNKGNYHARLQSQLSTWAAGIADRMIPMGGKCNQACMLDKSRIWYPTDCTDEQRLCKTLEYLKQAYLNLDHDHLDYLAGVQEDHYINREVFESQVFKLDPEEPTVHSGLGCAQSWEHHPSSNNGTLPKPRDWPLELDTKVCGYVQKHGGTCGGEGLVWSRAALKKFFQKQPKNLNDWMLPNGIKAMEWTGHVDPALSCLLIDRGIKLELATHKPRYEMRANFHKTNTKAAIIHIKDHAGNDGDDHVAAHMAEIHDAIVQSWSQ